MYLVILKSEAVSYSGKRETNIQWVLLLKAYVISFLTSHSSIPSYVMNA